MDVTTLVGAGVVLFVGSFIQRVTGMGLALIASPLLVLVLGPAVGVQVVQIVGLAVCAVSAWMLRADINYRKFGWLLLASVVGLIPGAWIARTLPSSWLMIVIGSITLIALASTRLLRRARVFEGTAGTGLAGALSGFMNITAGVGGPPLVIYATSTRWNYIEYVATVQIFFAALNALSVAGRGIPNLPPITWIVAAASSAVGLLLGHLFGARINDRLAAKAIVVIAVAGSLAAILRGCLAL